MPYSKTTWTNKVVDRPRTFTFQQNADGTVTLIPSEGNVTDPGIPVNASNMNHIEQGIADAHSNLLMYGTDTGSANTYAVTVNPAPTSYVAGMAVTFLATNANTGASTINVNGLGTKTIKKNISSDLASGDIKAGQVIMLIYDGTNFQFASSATQSNYNPLTSPSAWIN